MGKILSRAGRATIFDRRAYTESFFDSDAAADGAILVSLVGAASYVGFLVVGSPGGFSLPGLLEIVLGALIAWLILAFTTWFMATRLLGGSGRPQTMIAMHGLAPLPLLLEIGGQVILASVGLVWHLAILTMATREASDLDTRKAAVGVLVGFALAALIRGLIGVPYIIFTSLF